MDWFKKNPFMGALAAAAAVILLAGGYLVFAEVGRLDEEQTSFAEKKSQRDRLEANKPYPNQDNLAKTEAEAHQAGELLAGIAKGFAVTAPPLERPFQDELSKRVKEISALAADKGVELPETFYLGFDTYETQPPPPELAAALALQLQSVYAVAKVLVEAQVKSIGSITRSPLAGEAGAAQAGDSGDGGKGKGKKGPTHAFGMAPFDVNFTAEQSAFRNAFNRILNISPPIFVRLVSVANSAPVPPAKAGAPDAAAQASASGEQAEASGGIKAVLGREMLTVDLRLASITNGPNSP